MKTFTLRLDTEPYEELEKLATIYGVSKTAVLTNLIRGEYNKYEGDPTIQRTLDMIADLKTVLAKYQDE